MADSRSVPAIALLAATLIVALAAFLLLGDHDAADGGVVETDVVTPRDGAPRPTDQAPLSSEASERETLNVETKPEVAETIEYAQVDGGVRGRLVLAGDEAMPIDATIEVRLTRPRPFVLDALSAGFSGSPFDVTGTFESSDKLPAGLREFLEEADLETYELSRADVFVGDRTRTKIDADGFFELTGVPAHGGYLAVRHRFVYAKDSFALKPKDAQRAVGPNAELIKVPAEYGAVVQGTVADALGAPVAGVDLTVAARFEPWAILEGGIELAFVEPQQTDNKGQYEITQVPASRVMTMTATGKGRAAITENVPPLGGGDVHTQNLRMLRGGVITGLVVDIDGEAFPHGKVHMQPVEMDLSQISMMEARSSSCRVDGSAEFRFDELAAGEYDLTLSTTRSRMITTRVEVALDETTECTLVAERGLTVAGRVVTTAGEPIEGAWVKGAAPLAIMSMKSATEQQYRPQVYTDEDGRFELGGFDEGEITIRGSAHGFQPSKVDAEAGDTDVQLTCLRNSTLSGIVVSLDDGEPIQNFTIGVVPPGGSLSLASLMSGGGEALEGTRRPRVMESEDGTFHFDDVVPGEFDVYVAASDHAASFVPVKIGNEDAVRGVVVMMEPSATVTGQVVDATTRQPVVGAKVTSGGRGIMDLMSTVMLGLGSSTTTDEEGRFTLGELADERTQVNISHDSYLAQSVADVDVIQREETDIGVIALNRGATIHGKVFDEREKPVSNASVMASDAMGTTMRRTNTDSDGYYSVTGIAPGTYTVMRLDVAMDMSMENMADLGGTMKWESVEIVDDGEYTVDLRVDTDSGITLSGTVRGSGGPPPTAMVTLTPNRRGLGPVRFSSSNEDGKYTVKGLSPGPYTLQVVPMDIITSGGAAGGMPTSSVTAEVDITDAASQTHNIRLPGGRVHGVVQHAGTLDPVPEARVLLQRVDDDRPDGLVLVATDHRVGETFTDEEGNFSLDYIPDGTYVVTVGGRNLLARGNPNIAITRVEDVVVSEGGTSFGLDIEVKPGGRVQGIVRSVTGLPAQGVSVWARDSSGRWVSRLSEVMTEPSGAFEIVGLGSGAWTLACAHPTLGFTWLTDVRVDAPGTTPVNITMPPGVQVLVDSGKYDLADLEADIKGPIGDLPTNLSTLAQLTALTSGASSSLLVTVPAGQWSVTLKHDGDVIHRETVTLKAGQQTHTLGPFD